MEYRKNDIVTLEIVDCGTDGEGIGKADGFTVFVKDAVIGDTIVAKIMNKYLHVELGKAMSISGMCVALSSALIYDKKAVVLSVLGTYFNGIVLDHFIFGQNVKRRVCIITKYEEEVRRFILHELHSGATFYEACP